MTPWRMGADAMAVTMEHMTSSVARYAIFTLPDDAALAKAVTVGGRSRKGVIAGLLRLVSVDEQDHRIRRRVLRKDLPSSVATELDAFIKSRLLISTIDRDNGTVFIEVAHEAFLSAWPPLDEGSPKMCRHCEPPAESRLPLPSGIRITSPVWCQNLMHSP
jgi:hypothetical protein